MTDIETKSRRYIFTVNNYTKKDLKRFHVLAESLEKHRYICYGLEVAGTGTPHIQGYIELNEAQRFTFLHNYFDFKRKDEVLKFHIQPAKGTAEQNKKYDGKEGDFYEFGEPQTQGARNDLKLIKEAVKASPKNLPTIIDEMANNQQQLRFAESLTKYYFAHRNPNTPPNVFWIYGQTGVGKTRLVYRCFPDVCSVSDYKWIGTGYAQNECILFDDFRDGNLPFEQILKITDRYPYTLPVKGGHVELDSPYIIFTSPKDIETTFSWSSGQENLKQLKRRMVEIDLDMELDVDALDLRNYEPEA